MNKPEDELDRAVDIANTVTGMVVKLSGTINWGAINSPGEFHEWYGVMVDNPGRPTTLTFWPGDVYSLRHALFAVVAGAWNGPTILAPSADLWGVAGRDDNTGALFLHKADTVHLSWMGPRTLYTLECRDHRSIPGLTFDTASQRYVRS